MPKRRVLFLQLPLLDNDLASQSEMACLAADYLEYALERSDEAAAYTPIRCPTEIDRLGDRHIVELIVGIRPDVVAATLYLWNVERTLAVLRRVRRRLPGMKVVVGGPEVNRAHPFLYRGRAVDVAVEGEGEAVFAAVLRGLRTERSVNFTSVGWRVNNEITWGSRPVPAPELEAILTPSAHRLTVPDAHGVAYVETTRGCPASCTFCAYNQRRRGVTRLPRKTVVERILALRERGAREIRFIDPTFNANPDFEGILRALARINRGHGLSFFAELRAEWLTETQCRLLAGAGFTDVEVGVQSRDPAVLAAVRRPTKLEALDRGVAMLHAHGIRMTLDIMAGLPGQTLDDIRASLAWAARFGGCHVQLLHALLLPGTALREQQNALALEAMARPPYRVTRTPTLTEADLARAEQDAVPITGTPDCPTRTFVGRRLPDLFPETVRINLDSQDAIEAIPGRENRRALIFSGRDLYAHRERILALVRDMCRSEPSILWQFVLSPVEDFPLDLLDALIGELRIAPHHWMDGMSAAGVSGKRAARRILVLLRRGGHHAPSWIEAVDDLLRNEFY